MKKAMNTEDGERPTREARKARRSARPHAPAGVRDSAGHGAKLEAVRDRAVLALLSEKSITQAATKCGVNEKTLRRWLSDDADFKAAYAEARQTTFETGMSRAQALTGKAIDTLDELLGDTQHPNVRLGAARTIAELGIHQHDADVIMAKLDEIETARMRRGGW